VNHELQCDERFYARLRQRTAVAGTFIFLIPFLLFTVVVQFATERYLRRQFYERLQMSVGINAHLYAQAPAADHLLASGIGPSEDVFLVNPAGEFLPSARQPAGAREGAAFGPGQRNPFTGETGIAEFHAPDGRPVLVAYQRLPGRDAYLVSQVDRAEMAAPLRQLRVEIMLYVLPFLLLGLILAGLAWRYALNYIQRLMTGLYEALQVAHQRERERDLAHQELALRFERERELAREKAHFQTQLAEYEKYAALAQLALGAAHEINNPLLGILSHLELELRVAKDPQQRSEIEQCIEGARRISFTLRGLINYARPGPLTLSTVDLNRMVSETFSFLAHQPLFRGIRLESHLAAGLPALTADANQLSQVLMNLLLNAAEAMPKGGQIRVSAEPLPPDRVLIGVSDTGEGIPADVLPHVFEPFFTTKRGKGTGLGLSITQAYIRSHGGEIEVDSAPDRGTTVRIRMPVRQEVSPELQEQEVVG